MMQLGIALLQYTQENDGTLPSASTSKGHSWREALYPYIKSISVYQCPDDHNILSASSQHLPHSYGANVAVMAGETYAAPTASIAVTDMRGYDGPEWNMTSPAYLPNTGRKLYAHASNRYIFERINVINLLFSDGHVKALEPMETLTPTNLWTPSNAPFTGQDLANAQAILRHAEGE